MSPAKVDRIKILEQYESEIFGYIKNSVEDAEIARDLCQDVLIQALMNIDKLDFEQGIRSWLKTVSRNRVINFYRQRKRRQFVELAEDTLKTEIGSGDTDRIIEKSLNSMTDIQREVFVLRELEGYSYKELARHFNRSESAITSLVSRSRTRFIRQYLLQFLPDWINEYGEELSLEDLGRFINGFDPPLNLLREIQNKSQLYFEDIKEKWDRIHSDLLPKTILQEIMEFLGKDDQNTVLDLGCGSGVISAQCAVLEKRVISLDMNQGMLHELKKVQRVLHQKQLQLVCANMNHLPIKNIEFNEIFLTLVLHHIPDPKNILRQAGRLLTRGGYLIIVEFERHFNKQFADTMHDLWFGFKSSLLQKWCSRENLKVVKENHWNTDEKIEVYYRVFEKI